MLTIMRLVGSMFLLVGTAAGCASVPLVDSAQDAASKTFTAPPGRALIYIVRTGGYISGSYQLFRVTLDGRDQGELSDGTYFLFSVDPGRHSILAELENQESIQVDTAADGVYFIGLRSQMGYARARVSAGLLPEEEGKVAVRTAKMAAASADRAYRPAARTVPVGVKRPPPERVMATGGLKPTEQDKDGAVFGLAPGFDLRRYHTIIVALFPVVDSSVSDKPFAAQMAAFLREELRRRLLASGLFANVLNEASADPGGGVLRLEGKITHLSTGPSDAERALLFTAPVPGLALLGAFGGAGHAGAQIETAFVDAQSGRVELVTADRWTATLVFGKSKDQLEASFRDMASDLVNFLFRLGTGEMSERK